MPQDRFNNGDVRVLTIWAADLPPGVLTDVTVICELNTIQYGACVASVYMIVDEAIAQYANVALSHGVLSMMTPVSWQGNLSVPPGARLALQLRGHQDGWFRITWHRQTVTDIKETGNVQRAVNQPPA